MKWQQIKVGKTYRNIRVMRIYPKDSSWSGPGISAPADKLDDVSYRDYRNANWSSCTAEAFAEMINNRSGK